MSDPAPVTLPANMRAKVRAILAAAARRILNEEGEKP